MRRILVPLLAVTFVLLGAQESLALTLSEIRTAIRRNVRDTASSSSLRRYSDTVLNAFANEAQRAIINDTWAMTNSRFETVTAGVTTYSMEATGIKPYRVTVNSIPLPQLDIKQLDTELAGSSWPFTSGTPVAWYVNTGRTPNRVSLYPVPSETGAAIATAFYDLPADMTSDSSTPFNDLGTLYSYHDLVVFYVSFRILLAENRLAEADVYREIFNSGVEVMGANYGNKPVRPIKPSKEITP